MFAYKTTSINNIPDYRRKVKLDLRMMHEGGRASSI